MKNPNLFIIGAPKCGTTTLASWLSAHPEIFMSPVKEPHFFSEDFKRGDIKTRAQYDQLFADAGPEHKAVGEASTEYLYSSVAVDEIEREYSNPRYIVMIRNPIDMAYSLYNYEKQGGRETIDDFVEAWHRSPERRKGQFASKWCRDPKCLDYQGLSLFGLQLERLYKKVDHAKVHVIIFDELKENPQDTYLETLAFLGVSRRERVNYEAKNISGMWRHPRLGEVIRVLGYSSKVIKQSIGIPTYRGTGLLSASTKFLKTVGYKRLDDATRQNLKSFYASDIVLLSRLIDRDLSGWL